jgi:hypothetical protein|tara:strand:- start:1585 stop:2088 length:504 start_codon:yes stop_codon:yes gene_type:complete
MEVIIIGLLFLSLLFFPIKWMLNKISSKQNNASLTERLLNEFKGKTEYCNIRKKGKYITGSAKFSSKEYNKVSNHVEQKLKTILDQGEIITCNISDGKIIDNRITQFKVQKGRYIEAYDYTFCTAIFIRIYIISGESKKWLSLYIDENPTTPWWAKKKKSLNSKSIP